MSMDKKTTEEIIKSFGKHAQDSGSMETQAALCTQRIKYLTEHLKKHKKDNSSKRGLSVLLERRKRSLLYLKRHDEATYKAVIKQLNLKK